MEILDQTALNVSAPVIGPEEIAIESCVALSGESKATPGELSSVPDSFIGGKIGAHIAHPDISAPRNIFGPLLSITVLLILVRQRVTVHQTAFRSLAHIARSGTLRARLLVRSGSYP
jgi:hypothetical protein